jgi:hypothetical protein
VNTATKIILAITASDAEEAFFRRVIDELNSGAVTAAFQLAIQQDPSLVPVHADTCAVFLSPMTVLGKVTTTALAEYCGTFRGLGDGPLFLCTIFRHVPERRTVGAPLLERIHRCNLALLEISRATGAYVVDLDRAFAAVGAMALETDYRLHGTRAKELAAATIVQALRRVTPDDLPPVRGSSAESAPTP